VGDRIEGIQTRQLRKENNNISNVQTTVLLAGIKTKTKNTKNSDDNRNVRVGSKKKHRINKERKEEQ